ncbi:MAG: methyl-accepting chemotaxis protein [Clostridia bacterium]|jgi:methyl-accepting chemotaxis protein|nr:methyl-accepting chemotaxis protein [Clostridia bacterium]
MITKSITTPIALLVKLIDKTSNLDLVNDASFDKLAKHKDEIGKITKALYNMRAALKDLVTNTMTISNGLTAHSEELTATTEENTKSNEQMVITINEIADGNNSQASIIGEISSEISDMARTLQEVNITMSESAVEAERSITTVETGEKAVNSTTEEMEESIAVTYNVNHSIDELSNSIKEVGSITELITSIATETNLLALNAAIEAARAGEAGRGFAVVSDEIRKLAEGSSTAANKIKMIIDETVKKGETASKNMEKARIIAEKQKQSVNITKDAFADIKVSVDGIVKRVQDVAHVLDGINTIAQDIQAKTENMAATAQEAAASTEELSASGQQQLASIEMIGKAATELSQMAETLSKEINKFRI